MFRSVKYLIGGTLLALAPVVGWAGIVSFPGLGEPTFTQSDIDAAFARGRGTGRSEMAAQCIGDPENCGCNIGINPCGINLSSVLTGAQFGETEPNDHIVAADALIPSVIYWGQSSSLLDQDWFYVTTREPNQILTLTFTVPDRVISDDSRLSQGWLVSVRDAAGNIYARFDTRFAQDDVATANKNESKEITYPIFLGHVGTYYVTVEPRVSDSTGNLITGTAGSSLDSNGVTTATSTDLNSLSVLYWPYNLAAVLTFSGLDTAPPDVNFHDVEFEPNNSRVEANALTSGVTMYGLLRQTSDTVGTGPEGNIIFTQGDVDWFKYYSPGNEQISLAWCGREACSEDAIWYVEVQRPNGSPILSFNTDKAETVHFGLGFPGYYYVQVRYQRLLEATCATLAEEPSCLASTYQCQVLSYTEGDPDADPPVPATCSYAAGTICGAGAESETTRPCERDGVSDDYPVWRWDEVCSSFGFACEDYATTDDTNALNVEYNFNWWGTKPYPLTNGTPDFDAFRERPAFYEGR
jgi:hypothetical protein